MIQLIPQEGQGWQIRIILRQQSLSDEEGSIGEFKEDDGEWSGSNADEISPDISDPN